MAGEALLGGVLRGVVSNLSSPLLNEFWLLWGLEADKKKLESYLSSMEAVLRDAERRQVKEETVKVWLKKLKDAAYDADDLVEEFVIEARRRKALNKAGMREKVGNLFYPPVFRFKMAHKMQKLRERFDYIAKEKNDLHFAMGVVDNHQPPISITRETDSCVPEWKVYGRDDEKEKLIDSLINSGNEEALSVIPIVGMGGLGKTTMAQLVFNDERVVAHFDPRRWVYVSEDFDLKRLLKEISQHNSSTDQSSIELLQTHLREELSGKKYLLILDDVWNGGAQGEFVEKWHRLKTWLACGSMGSKILVTTRNTEVADAMGTLPTHSLGKLSENDSWTLFEKLANPNPNFVSIGKEIVGKCDGLPLAVKTLGGLMSSKKTEREWESVKNSEFWTAEYNDGIILPTLRLSYDHLTSSLKQCFAYCAIFAKGYFIDKDELVKQWIALGFIPSYEKNGLLEEEGECYFNVLIQRSLFEVGIDRFSNEPTYKMHDLVHDLLRFVAGKECSIIEASMDIAASMEIAPEETRHLSWYDDIRATELESLKALKKLKKLRSIFLPEYFFDVNICSSLRCLRILDLSNTSIDHLPNSIDKLQHLRYLDVSGTIITELPETLCNLCCVQTLTLNRTGVKKLPKDMKKMTSLRHIQFDGILRLPKGIGELTCLRTLSIFVVGEESEHEMEELNGLNLLSGHIRIKGLDNVSNEVCASKANLKVKQHLHSLELSWSNGLTLHDREGNSDQVLQNLEPHSNLKKLVVEDYMGLNFPSWMMMLTKLVEVKLLWCSRCERLQPLWQLRFLESLEIRGMSAVKYIVEFDETQNYKDLFPSLKHLTLSRMPSLEGWSSQQEDGDGDGDGRRERDEQVILPHLRHLEISDCKNLIRLPQFHLLTALECLWMKKVACKRIRLPMSQSLYEVKLTKLPSLESWSSQDADNDEHDQVIFLSLRNLQISDCPKLICLPRLCLPALEYFIMTKVGCEKIELSPPSSLKYFFLADMPNLERWSRPEADYGDDKHGICPHLDLGVHSCPKMVCLPHLSSLKSLRIVPANEVLFESVANCTSPVNLQIKACPTIKILPEELGRILASLHTLEISKCPKLMSLSNQFENLTALRELRIVNCSDLVLSLPVGLQQQQQCPPLNSLKRLEIINSCEKQTLFPGEGIVLTSLRELVLKSSENLESLSFDGLKNITNLTITECPKVWSSLGWIGDLTSVTELSIVSCPGITSFPESMENLTSLKTLEIRNCPVMSSLPKSMENITSLTSLEIADCPVMRSLPEWVGNLPLLTSINIKECPAMTALPESVGNLRLLEDLKITSCRGIMTLPDGLQHLRNLQYLRIFDCPVLRRQLRCRNRRKGQDWYKVAHVPNIRTDGGSARDHSTWEESINEGDNNPSIFHSLKRGCNKFNKKLHFPSCSSSSSSP